MGRRPKISVTRPDGSKISLVQLAEETGLSYDLLYSRYRDGWPAGRLSTPKQEHKPPVKKAKVVKKRPRQQKRYTKCRDELYTRKIKAVEPEEDWSMAGEMQGRARKALAEFKGEK